ncbi:hypothetical protein [Spirillospora sp. CA-294931]|uniref:hypothetical protein n=1 Tax=Spirillospora sp. CA-294931 TaxID=3240042 RepID=UPI003D940EB7
MNTHQTAPRPPEGIGAQATSYHAADPAASRPITNPNDTPTRYPAPRPLLRTGPVKRCPTCRTPLDGGPVHFRCEPCGRAVMAAALDTDYQPAPNAVRTGHDTAYDPEHGIDQDRRTVR